MNELIPFKYQNHEVRVVLDDQGEPWFVVKDVCEILERNNPADAVKGLDDDEKGIASSYTLGGEQDMVTVNESGLYTLIIRSYKPQAKPFRRWVTHDVLPSIRKTGRYIHPAVEERFARLAEEHRVQAYFYARENDIRNEMIVCKGREVAALNLALTQQQALIAEKDRVNELLKANHALQEKQKQARTVVWARPQRRRHRPISEEVKQQIISLKRQGHTNGQIAKNMDRGRSTVSLILKEAGFPPGRPFYMQKASNPESSSSEVHHG